MPEQHVDQQSIRGGFGVLRTLVSHYRIPRNDLIGLGIWNSNSVFLPSLINLDHHSLALAADDVSTLSKLRL